MRGEIMSRDTRAFSQGFSTFGYAATSNSPLSAGDFLVNFFPAWNLGFDCDLSSHALIIPFLTF